MVKKCIFLKVVKIRNPKKRFLVNLRSFFITYKVFLGRGWFFSVSALKDECFNEKTSCLAVLKKSYSIFRKSNDFGHFWLHGSTFRVSIFSTYRQNFKKSLVIFSREVVWKILLNFQLSIFKKVRGVAVSQVDIFQIP